MRERVVSESDTSKRAEKQSEPENFAPLQNTTVRLVSLHLVRDSA
jgi:hypothetical protein